MIKYLLLVVFASFCFASQDYAVMKNCETIKLSRYTTLVSCHNLDYLVEFKVEDDNEKDNIKKITAITTKDKKIIKTIGK